MLSKQISCKKHKPSSKERKGDQLIKIMEKFEDHYNARYFLENPDPLKAINLIRAQLDRIEKQLKTEEN